MSMLKNVVGGGAGIKPTFRFGGWGKMGAITRPADTRTKEQLLANIDYFAEKNPEVAQLKKELKSIQPKYLGLVSDICELGNHHELLSKSIDMRELKNSDGKSLFSFILEKLPKASKENPKAMEFTQEVINNTDVTASKYFLADFGEILDVPEAQKHLEATKPLIKTLAEETLSGGYAMNFEKEKNFMAGIKTLVNPEAIPENISVLSKAINAIKALPDSDIMKIDRFVSKGTPIPQIEANIPRLRMASDVAHKQGKSLDIVDFLTTNVNYAKAPQKIDMNSIKNGNIKLA